METRIYKRLLNRKETIASFTVWFKPTKKAAQDGAIINAYCCNIDPYGRVCGYWEDYPPNTRVRADIRLGKRQKLADVPKQIAEWAKRKTKIFSEACKTGNWDKWNED